MEEMNVDYLLLGPFTNFYYLTGLKTTADERLQLAILDASGDLTLIMPEMYRQQVEERAPEGRRLFWDDKGDPFQLVKDILKVSKETTIAIDDRLNYLHLYPLLDLLGQGTTFPASRVMEGVRSAKEPGEISLMERAAGIADQVVEEMAAFITRGRSEREIALEVETRLKNYGGDELSFSPIVAGGVNSCRPHHSPGNYRLCEGDFVTLDLGCRVEGYCSDITRTYFLGRPSPQQREVYRVVNRAREQAIKALEPGMTCEEADGLAREVIAAAGYGEYFLHRTGHGIGLDCHEIPYLVAGNQELLQEGMVFSVEPGIYLSGNFGVRIEDIVLLTANGARSLNRAPRELITVD